MTEADTPPLPRIALRFGITGHRLNKIRPDDRDAVEAAIGTTLEAFQEATERVVRDAPADPGLAASHAPPILAIVSALAEGADRMAYRAAPAGWTRRAILPMPIGEYERDFLSPGDADSPSLREFRTMLAQAQTVTELPASGPTTPREREELYEALGRFLVGQIDVLVAVWDGRAAEGPGGTAAVIRRALDRDVAVIWISPDGRPGERLIGFPGRTVERPLTAPLSEADILSILRPILGVPSPV